MFQTIKSRELIITILFYNVENAEMVVYRASIVWTLIIHSICKIYGAFIAGTLIVCIFPYYPQYVKIYGHLMQVLTLLNDSCPRRYLLNNFFTVLTSTVQECFLT